jgi:hypothetical protein
MTRFAEALARVAMMGTVWAALVSAGCKSSSGNSTRLDVVVDVDPALMLDSVAVVVEAQGISADARPTLEHTFAVSAPSGTSSAIAPIVWEIPISNAGPPFQASVTASGNGPMAVTATILATIEAGQRTTATLTLASACVAKSCPSDQTCMNGACGQIKTVGPNLDAGSGGASGTSTGGSAGGGHTGSAGAGTAGSAAGGSGGTAAGGAGGGSVLTGSGGKGSGGSAGGSSGTGGTAGSGGAAAGGQAGTTSTGGATGTGGMTATGGVTGTGGMLATGGTKGSGGSAGAGGMAGTGGTTGTGGSAGGGGTVMHPPMITNGTNGLAARYWDCCKPSCGWTTNVSVGNPMMSCDSNDNSLGSNYTAVSACTNPSAGTAYMCSSAVPWSLDDTLSYGYAAAGFGCGQCYQLQFTGTNAMSGQNTGTPALIGKTMIVQIINSGSYPAGQFQLLIPGGGVGAFTACATQWNATDLGSQYGGWLTECSGSASCVMQKCQATFSNKPDLMAGCNWFLGWFGASNDPDLVYQRIACPAGLTQASGLTDPG